MKKYTTFPYGWLKRNLRLLFCVMFALGAAELEAATYTVTNVNDSGSGSLRQALLNANSNPGYDTVAFNIPGTGPFIITSASVLPTITDPVLIDGTTQPGYAGTPLVEINGSNIGANNDGLMVTSGGTTILGLAINLCPRDGIRLEGIGANVIQGNFLGTDATGTVANGNGEGGLVINGSVGNLIGGTNAATRNLISGRNQNGIYLLGSGSVGNIVEGNYIGTDVTGMKSLGNVNNGIENSGAPGNTIGGIVPGARNIISGNGESGVYILTSGATGNFIEGNYIGLNVNGNGALGNVQDGVTLYGIGENTVGGTNAAERNIISGNGNAGVDIVLAGSMGDIVSGNYIGTDVTGKLAIPNQANGVIINAVPGNIIGGTNAGAGNVISGNLQNGILITAAGSFSNLVEGNFVGVDVTGATALPNTYDGVTIDGAAGNFIGGTNGGNVISGNVGNGVLLIDSGGGSNTVQGNLIGTDYTGKNAVPNAQAGIYISVPSDTIGGLTAAVRNVISGNSQNGIFIYGSTASNNLVEGNYIGLDITGEVAMSNIYAGVDISNAPANTIGGTTAGAGNVISANGNSGVILGGTPVTGTIVEGNYIGTDATGGNPLGNLDGGIYFYGAGANTIGGAAAGAGNLISGNLQEGISVGDPGANYNTIQANFLGTKADGISALGNQLHNIDFTNTASNNLVGGTVPAEDNRIGFVQNSLYDGVRIRAGCLGNFISRNSIFSNGFLGIVIGAAAAINTSNMVVLTEAVSAGEETGVQGTLNTYSNGQFLIQFYNNITPNKSGYGEGLIYLGSTSITTGTNGQASFAAALPTGSMPGTYVSATATDSNNTTWEFCADLQVGSPPSLSISQPNGGGNHGMEPVTISWPTTPPNFILQETTNLNPPAIWYPATNMVTTTGTTNSITFTPTDPPTAMFFRLSFQ